MSKIREDSSEGCILEVEIKHHEELHDMHIDYPLAPEKSEFKESMLPDYCREFANKHNILDDGVKKNCAESG